LYDDQYTLIVTDLQGVITLESLRLELHAGRISVEHEEEALQQLQKDNLDSLNFMDFLVRFVVYTRRNQMAFLIYFSS
jgi:hypothetical protein